MNKKVVSQIEELVKLSQVLDENGYPEDAFYVLCSAFEVAEEESLRLAAELNSMTKTASVEDRTAKLKDLEDSFVVTAGIGDLISKGLKGIGNWATKKALPGIKKGLGQALQFGRNVGNEMKGKIPTKAHGLLQNPYKRLNPTALENAGYAIGGTKNWNQIAIQLKKAGFTKQEIIAAQNNPAIKNALINATDKQAALKAIAEISQTRGLSNTGKAALGLGAGVAGLGAANAIRTDHKNTPPPIGPTGSTLPGGSARSTIPGGGGPFSSGGPYANQGNPSQSIIADIENRVSELEQVVQAIRVKVGV